MADRRRARRSPRRVVAAVLALLVIILGIAAPARMVLAGGPAEADPAAAYWTAERIRGATPRASVLQGGVGIDVAATPAAPAGVAAVTGEPWMGDGAVVDQTGLILFTLSGADYSCSGSIVEDGGDPTYSLVLTAAHCAYDQDADVFATNWVFIPAWDLTPTAASCTATTHGCWAARALVVHDGWAAEELLTVEAVTHDYAVAVVRQGGESGTQLDALGDYPVRIGGVDPGDELTAFGYPAGQPYDGDELVYCQGPVGIEPETAAWGVECDMTSGASGGPWLYGATDPADGSGEVASVSSFRIINDDHLYGPRFTDATRDVYLVAQALTPDADLQIDGVIVENATPFTDIATSTFLRDIEWLYLEGITTGCTPTRFCPKDDVTRGQMAAFLVRALGLPPTGTDHFIDDEGNTFEADIDRLAAAGITKGCTPDRFCPGAKVTRGQMAAFLVRALDLPSTTIDAFTDDETSTFERDIDRLAAAGITTGCTPTTFCPDANVTREQMAAFLHRALD